MGQERQDETRGNKIRSINPMAFRYIASCSYCQVLFILSRSDFCLGAWAHALHILLLSGRDRRLESIGERIIVARLSLELTDEALRARAKTLVRAVRTPTLLAYDGEHLRGAPTHSPNAAPE